MKESPSMDAWLKEAKSDPQAHLCGMYLYHNGVVRATAKARVRHGQEDAPEVTGMFFRYDAEAVKRLEQETLEREGIYYVRTWLNEGHLQVGDDIMYVLIGGDIRPHVVDALQFLVGAVKNSCVTEQEKHSI